jgi:DNA adenine methylase
MLITYDNDAYVRELAVGHGFQYNEIAMQNTHLAKMTELIIGRNLAWS